jgi:hypothetical protein
MAVRECNAMLERRKQFRGRVYYGGRVAFNERCSTLDCVIRNFSDDGAKLDIANACLLSGEIDLTIPRKGLAFRGRVIWQRGGQAGFAFVAPPAIRSVMTLDWALRLRASERSNKAMQRSIDALRSGW